MGHLLRHLMWTFAVSRGADELKLALRRASRRAALSALGLVLALVSAGFLLAAGVMALADVVGAVRACLIVGAALALAGTGFLLYAGRRRAPARLSAERAASSHLNETLIEMGRDLGAAAGRNPGAYVAAAFAIGIVLGRMRR